MFLLQEILKNSPESNSYFQYRNALIAQGLPFEIITLKNNEITFLNEDFTRQEIDQESHLNKLIQKPFVPLGSIQMKNLFLHTPKNIFYQTLKSNPELFKMISNRLWLNAGSQIGLLKDLETNFENVFFRPLDTNKLINGQILTNDEFQKIKNSKNLKLRETEFSISKIQNIKSESRFFIVENKIITSSNYIIENKLNISHQVTTEKYQFVQKILEDYPQIGSSFVIDVCQLADDTIKIVEFNDIQASGLYSGSAYNLITAFNKLQIKQ